jgi:nucleoid-associated protein YgaU
MGLFDFVKDAGKKLFGSSEANAAEAIAKEVGDPNLKDKIKVEVDGDKVKVHGEVPSQEMKEKIIVAAGNVEGISQVEEDLTTTDKNPEATFHTVQKGDTLWAVAQKSYGDGTKFKLIFEANRPMLSDPDKIYPGQVLRIPSLEKTPSV